MEKEKEKLRISQVFARGQPAHATGYSNPQSKYPALHVHELEKLFANNLRI
jgi:hypothetical protein